MTDNLYAYHQFLQSLQHRVSELAMESIRYLDISKEEQNNIEKNISDLNTLSFRRYITSFSDCQKRELFASWIEHSSYCNFSLKKHRQSLSCLLVPEWRHVSFYRLFLCYCEIAPGDLENLRNLIMKKDSSQTEIRQALYAIMYDAFCGHPIGVPLRGHLIRNLRLYMEFHPKANPLEVYFRICTPEESTGVHKIERHPSWCYHNINKQCDIFHTQCHTTINCPYFKKCIKLGPGIHKTYINSN